MKNLKLFNEILLIISLKYLKKYFLRLYLIKSLLITLKIIKTKIYDLKSLFK